MRNDSKRCKKIRGRLTAPQEAKNTDLQLIFAAKPRFLGGKLIIAAKRRTFLGGKNRREAAILFFFKTIFLTRFEK